MQFVRCIFDMRDELDELKVRESLGELTPP